MRKAIVMLIVLLAAGTALAANELIVTELMYNSINLNDEDVEWIEIYNASDATIDLTGWYVLDDNETHVQVPLSGSMAPGEVMVLAGTESQFTEQYPTVTNYFPVFFQEYGTTWALGNGGDGVRIHDDMGNVVFTMDYDDGGDWPGEADGDGPSLLLISTGCTDFADPNCWTAGPDWGTPGVLQGTVGNEDATWGELKGMFR